MPPWHDALQNYRRRSLQPATDAASDVMFVLCSENYAAAAVVAACEPAMVLQTFGAARDPADAAVRATFEYALRVKRVRKIVFCGHLGCQAVAFDGDVDRLTATRAEVVAQCRKLRQDPHLGPLLRDRGVTLRIIWFDDREGDVFACDAEGKKAMLMSDDDFERLLTNGEPAPK